MKYYVIINGESSLDIQGLAIESLPSISKPLMRSKREEIDGRNGDIITQLGYGAYDKTLKIGLWGDYDINEVITFFNQEGTITFSNEPDMYYNFTILNRIDFINQLEAFRKATITIHCQPFKYKEEETETLELEEHQVEGTSFSLEGTIEAPMQIDLKGNTSQVQLSGKNLFNINEYTNAILRGGGNAVALTKEDDITLKTLNKVSQTQNYCLIPIPNSDNLLGKTITISGNITLNNVSATTVNMYFISDGTYIGNNIFSENLTSEGDFTLTGTIPSSYPSGATRLALGIYGSGSTVQPVNSYAIWKNIQLELGSTATTYEQYCGGTPSPNPSYPQDIHNVSGNNDIVVCGKNLFDKNDITTGLYYYASGTSTSENWAIAQVRVQPNTNYYLSGNNYNNTTAKIVLLNSSKNIISDVGVYKDVHLITTNSNTAYIGLSIANYEGSSDLSSIQLEQGNQATTYEAYNGTTYPINLPVENLFDKDNANITNFYSTATAFNQNNSAVTIIIPIQENNNYTISSTNRSLIDTSANVTYTSEIIDSTSDTYLQRTMWASTDNSLTTTAPIGAKYMYCYVKWTTNQTDIDNCLATIQLEKGSKANSYTPYGTTPIELNKIGTYQDYIYKDSDKWYLHKEIGKIVLDGSETGLSYDFNCLRILNSTFKTFETTEIGEIYSNYYTKNKQETLQNNVVDYGISYRGAPANGMVIRNKDITSLNDFKTWLSTHNTIINYILATPTNTEITDTTLISQLEAIYNAKSKNGITNINQENNDLPFILDVSYLSGTDNITITNHGNYYSKPKLTLTGTGNIGIYLNDSQIFQVSLGTNETIIIDTDKMEAYYESTLKNRQVIGDYNSFKLLSGENTIRISGTFSKLQVDNYSRWI